MAKPERTIHLPSLIRITMFVSGFLAGMFFSSTIFELAKTFSGSGVTSAQGTAASAKDFATTNAAGALLGVAIILGIIIFIKKMLIVATGFTLGFFIRIFLQTQGIMIPTLDVLLRSILPI